MERLVNGNAENSSNLWKFARVQNFSDARFDGDLKFFYKLGVEGLVRENIQNSLDGALRNSGKPVVVKVNTGRIGVDKLPGIYEVIDHIRCLKGGNRETKNTIKHMLNKIDQKEVNYISFEDINTKGLSGAKNGQSNSDDDTYGAYAYRKGVHPDDENDQIETARGGSHGVGKIASNAASDLHVMYFANCDEYHNQHLGANVQLIEHLYNDKCYNSTGCFSKQEVDGDLVKYYPYENKFSDLFEKNTRGLKIIIPYLRDEYNNEKDIIKSVCDNFFVSILSGRLEVCINDKIIKYDNIEEYVFNASYYEKNVEEMKDVFTPLYVKTFINETPRDIHISDGREQFTFKLYFNYDERIPKGRVAIIRTVGMKIEDFKVYANATKPFNAVLIGGLAEDKYLKLLENKSHTQISKDHIEDERIKNRAGKFIRGISNEIAKVIDEKIKEINPPDGKIDTSDLIYEEINKFEQQLKKTFSVVKINNGKEVTKTTTLKMTEVPVTRQPGTTTGTVEPKNTGVKRTKRMEVNQPDSIPERSPEVYRIKPDLVDRIIVKNNEYIAFNFKGNSEMNDANSMNLSFKVIDGMGEEYDNEFKFTSNYERIIDSNTGLEVSFDDKKIKNLSIKDCESKVKLYLKTGFNRKLKFIYYVEV